MRSKKKFGIYEYFKIMPISTEGLANLLNIIDEFDISYTFDVNDDLYIPLYSIIYKDYDSILTEINLLLINNKCKGFYGNDLKLETTYDIYLTIDGYNKYFYKKDEEGYINIGLINYEYLENNEIKNSYKYSELNPSQSNKNFGSFFNFFKLNDLNNNLEYLFNLNERDLSKEALINNLLCFGYFKLVPTLEKKLIKYFYGKDFK